MTTNPNPGQTATRSLYRIASVLAFFASINACGAMHGAEQQVETAATSIGNSNSQETVTQTMARDAALATNPATETYLSQCKQNAACANDANQVATLITQATQEIQTQQDASATLRSFDTALTVLAQCISQHPTTDGNQPTPPPTACSAHKAQCVSNQLPNGEIKETCECNGAGSTGGTTTAGATTGSGPGTTTGTTTGITMGTTGGGTNTAGATTGSGPGTTTGGTTTGGSGSNEKCVAAALPDGGMSVTCTYGVK